MRGRLARRQTVNLFYVGSNPTARAKKGENMPRIRKKIEDYLDYPDKSHVQLESPSGWCITKDHNECPYQFRHGKCGCKCHKETK